MEDIITLTNENNEEKDYKLLFVINKEYQYLIYTDLYNTDYKSHLYAIKTRDLDTDEEILPISDSEWDMIEKTYNKLINV